MVNAGARIITGFKLTLDLHGRVLIKILSLIEKIPYPNKCPCFNMVLMVPPPFYPFAFTLKITRKCSQIYGNSHCVPL